MAASAIPATLTALLAALRAAPGLKGVDVFDGPPTTGENPDYLCVGHDPAGGPEAVEADQSSASLGARRRQETFDVLCALAAWSGDDVMSVRRARAYTLLGAVETVLRDDVTLGGVVMSAQMGANSLLQEQTSAGASAGIRFRVACTARI